LKKYLAKILLIIESVLLFGACSAIKRVPNEAQLLTNSSIITNNKLVTDDNINSFIIQRPNQKLLGLPLALYFYNNGNPEVEKTYSNWLLTKEGKKPVSKFRRNINNWFLKNGSAPIILEASKTKKTVNSLTQFYFNLGYFDVKVTAKTTATGKKRAAVKYLVKTNQAFTIATFKTDISSPYLDSIYKKNERKSMVKSGDVYNSNNFEKEEDRLIALFRNSGLIQFTKNIIKFDVDTSNATHSASVLLKIPNRIITDAQGNNKFIEFLPQKIKSVNVITDYNFDFKDETLKDSAQFNNINFYAFSKIKYNPKFLSEAISIAPGIYYNDIENDNTRTYLNNLKNFNVAINYTENPDNTLTADILLNPLKKYSFGVDAEITHSNVKPAGITSKLSFTNHNIFKGAENLTLSFEGSFINSAKDASTNSSFFDAYEYGANISLTFPRILFPFNISKLIPKTMEPITSIEFGTSIQQNIGLDRQNVTGVLDYTWKSSKKISHNLELLNVQFIRNFKTSNYFNIYESEYNKLNVVSQIYNGTTLAQTDADIINFINTVLADNTFKASNFQDYLNVQNVNSRRSILIEDVLVPTIGYTFTYQNKEDFNDNNFSYFRANIVSSGLLSSALTKIKPPKTSKELFKLPIAQFIKTQVEYKKYWGIDHKNTLVFRSFAGLALAYGNSTAIPFSRSYFAGGSNELRAWRAYELGPGKTQSNLEFNVGNFKLVGNIEYRFKIFNSFNGALFLDAGNIWNVSTNSFIDDNTKFKGFSSLKDIAVGSGFGLRYDFNFLVFRFDMGFKTYEPYLLQGKKWFTNYNFSHAVYNIGINYPF